ncbi:hypothetical protein GCM10022222_71400 [Amycolatopsis ultiminotia]|uniref:Dihydropteroate synthase n=1 Tax=Amycolatopsis ultiminotia TaxID=543629 RepID=A0ABP6Y2I0_9PSEU
MRGRCRFAEYGDAAADVRTELLRRLDAVVSAGVALDRCRPRSGPGFAKTPTHSWQLLDELRVLGRSLLIGAVPQIVPPPEHRDGATAAVSILAALADADCLRVHDVPGTIAAIRVVAAWETAGVSPMFRSEHAPPRPDDAVTGPILR